MDGNTLNDSFRKQLTNVHALTVLTVSLFEVIGYIVLIHAGVEEFSLRNVYLWTRVVLPIAANLINHLIARAIVNRPGIKRKAKNAAIISAALITSFLVAVLHKEYIITSCAFVFPMILSAMFNDKKLLNASLITSLGILVCVGIAFEIDKTATLVTMLNLFILFGFALISYLCGIISINFSALSYQTIKTQAESNSKLRDNVLRDQMTGLYNHNTFIEHLDKQVQGDDAICLVMLDIDDFKQVNDTFGHDCGDDVLIFVADAIRKYCTKMDTPYRYGGEEFAIIFKNKSVQEVRATMEDMLAYVSKHRFEFTDNPLTFSAGVAEYTQGLTSDAFFELADQTLYTAKRTGKNQILDSNEKTAQFV